MTDEDLRWCDVCDDCSHYKAVGDEKYQCTLEGGRCRGYFAYKKLKAENAALRERLEKAVELPSGDRVWFITEDEEGEESYIISKPTDCLTVDELYEIGKKYFTTYEAAEARLAELKGEEK